MSLHTSLSDRIGAKKYTMVMNILNNSKEIDVTYNEGEFFIIAISNNSTEIVKALLEYFKKNQLEDPTIERLEDMTIRDKLLMMKIRDILDTAIQDVNLSEEMQKIIIPYGVSILDNEDYVRSEVDPDDFDFNTTTAFEYEQDKEVKISGDNIIEHNNHTEIVS